MDSINKCYTLFFDSITFDDDLVIKVTEGKRAEKPESLNINNVDLGEAYKVEPDDSCKRFTVLFENPVAWQVVDESYTSEDKAEKYELRGHLSILSKSKYLDYINGSHGFYKDIVGQGKHYRLWTEDQVIEIISIGEPSIHEV